MGPAIGISDKRVSENRFRRAAQMQKKMSLPPLVSRKVLQENRFDEKTAVLNRIRWCLSTREDIKIMCSPRFVDEQFSIRCKNKECEYIEDWDGSGVCMLSIYLTDHMLRTIDMKRYARNQSVN